MWECAKHDKQVQVNMLKAMGYEAVYNAINYPDCVELLLKYAEIDDDVLEHVKSLVNKLQRKRHIK